jgi:choloylglycine hydrolase
MPINKRTLAIGLVSGVTLGAVLLRKALACTRVVHKSEDGSYVVTGRNMDWFEDIESNIWLFPRGMKRDGAAGKNSAQWVSKYGSVITAGFDLATTDGLNEEGLMVNFLYLAESDFGERDETRPGLSWSVYAQYILDNFASVEEAVEAMKDDTLQVVASPLPGSTAKPPTTHWSISDAEGDSAIFEYLDGKLVIHHGKQCTVMTNSPPYDQQIALNAYWETVGGEAMLPGTRRAADRFVRASYYTKLLPDPKTDRQAIANVMSVMRNVSVPFGATDPSAPNIAPTIWRTAADHVRKIYFFESTLSPYIIWVRLKSLDFKPGAPVKKLELVGNYDLAGDVSDKFVAAEPFTFIGPA